MRDNQKLLEPLFKTITLSLKALEGSVNLHSAGIFKEKIDPYYFHWSLDVKQSNSEETKIRVYELIADARFKSIFTYLDKDLKKLCLTQGQIVEYFKTYNLFLKSCRSTFFLFEEKEVFYVANISALDVDESSLEVYQINEWRKWHKNFQHRVVVKTS